MLINRIFSLFLAFFLALPAFVACRAEQTPPDENRPVASEGEAFFDTLTFLGDSTTAHMQQRSAIPKERIWATAERYLNLDSRITYAKIVAPDSGAQETIATVAARLQPRRLVITLGIDYGVYYYRDRPELFRLYYGKLLDAISEASPRTTLILQSIFPVGRNARGVTNAMVASANAIIAEIAQERALFFVDQTPVLADTEGFLRDEYCYSEDGLHLTASAYTAILGHFAELEDKIP